MALRVTGAVALVISLMVGGIVWAGHAIGFTCEQRQRRHVSEIRAQADPLFADIATRSRPLVYCVTPGDIGSKVMYVLPYTPRRDMTRIFHEGGWRLSADHGMSSPDSSFCAEYAPSAHSRRPVYTSPKHSSPSPRPPRRTSLVFVFDC